MTDTNRNPAECPECGDDSLPGMIIRASGRACPLCVELMRARIEAEKPAQPCKCCQDARGLESTRIEADTCLRCTYGDCPNC